MKLKLVTLYSSNLKEQKEFYTQLGFRLLEEQPDSISLKIGKTLLRFVYRKTATIYHFALNIPSNQGAAALALLKKRVEILDLEGAELVDFANWNAEAMYFYDADKNIVEFIARKNLADNSDLPFSADNVLEISELGVPTDNITTVYKAIRRKFPIEIYSGSLDRFCAAGDERGLFIIIDNALKKWIPRDDVAVASDFEILLEFEGQEFGLVYENGVLT